MEFISAARLVGAHATVFLSELVPLLRDVVDALVDTTFAVFRLLSALARPAAGLLQTVGVALRPLVAALLSSLWQAFASQTPGALAKEAAAASVISTLLALEHRLGLIRSVTSLFVAWSRGVARSYSSFKRNVRDKSATAAALMSHAVFLIPSAGLFVCFGPGVDAFAQRWGLFAVSVVSPSYRTIYALYSMDNDDDDYSVQDECAVTPTVLRGRRFLDTPSGCAPASRAAKLLEAEAREGQHLSNESDDAEASDTDSSGGNQGSRGARPARDTSTASPILIQRRRNLLLSASTATPALPESLPSCSEAVVDGSDSIATQTSGEKVGIVSALRRRMLTPASFRKQPRKNRGSSPVVSSSMLEAELLRFWVVYGVAWAVRSLARFFVPAIMSGLTSRLDTFLFFFIIWLQIGLTRGADTLFPIVATFLRQSHYLRSTATRSEQLNIGLRMLVACGLISTDKAAIVGETIAESGLALVGVIFFITPRVPTFIGTVLIGYCVPIYLTVSAASSASLSSTRYTWLCYWVVYALVDSVYNSLSDTLDWLPLWYHCKLAIILWLQTPVHRGASFLLDRSMSLFVSRVVSMYRRRAVTPHKRKRA
jgi:TB2/DP1, HVA22 family